MKMSIIYRILLSAVLYGFSGGSIAENPIVDKGTLDGALINALGCTFAIPGDYVLNTNESGRFLFYKRLGTGAGVISISKYSSKGIPVERFSVMHEEQIGRLTVVLLRSNVGAYRDPQRAALIHDERQVLTIFGADADLWKKIIESCT